VPSALEVLVLPGCVCPWLTAYYLSRTGREKRPMAVPSFALTGSWRVGCAATDGIGSFGRAIWLVSALEASPLGIAPRRGAGPSTLRCCAACWHYWARRPCCAATDRRSRMPGAFARAWHQISAVVLRHRLGAWRGVAGAPPALLLYARKTVLNNFFILLHLRLLARNMT